MDHRNKRNEFGLDELNEEDVQKERDWSLSMWIVGGLATFSVFAALAFYTTKPTDLIASNPPPAVATTTGSALH